MGDPIQLRDGATVYVDETVELVTIATKNMGGGNVVDVPIPAGARIGVTVRVADPATAKLVTAPLFIGFGAAPWAPVAFGQLTVASATWTRDVADSLPVTVRLRFGEGTMPVCKVNVTISVEAPGAIVSRSRRFDLSNKERPMATQQPTTPTTPPFDGLRDGGDRIVPKS